VGNWGKCAGEGGELCNNYAVATLTVVNCVATYWLVFKFSRPLIIQRTPDTCRDIACFEYLKEIFHCLSYMVVKLGLSR
jgi:hypothetical protein